MKKATLLLSALFGFSGALCAGPALRQLPSTEVEVPPAASPAAEAEQVAAALDAAFSFVGEAQYPAARPSPLKQEGEAAFSAELEPLRDNYLRTEAYFTTGKGTKVRVSLAKANCVGGGTDCEGKDKAVFTLLADGGPSFLIRGMDIANFFPIYSGSKTLKIDGEDYKVKLFPKPLDPVSSQLEVKGPGGRGIKITMKRLSEVLVDKCAPVKLSKQYKMAYASEVDQADGRPKFTARRQLILYPFPMDKDYSHTVLSVSDIKGGGTQFPQFEPSYTFRVSGGRLEITR
jgi:hypothetical protein